MIAAAKEKSRHLEDALAYLVYQLMPATWPEIVSTSSGPSIFHADFSPVTAGRPARAGEILIVRATGLGPTRPGVTPGQPFPADPLQEVNSPVQVLVGDRAAEVVNKAGWPGLIDTYRVDFRFPQGIPAGFATARLSAAWVAGPAVQIAIRHCHLTEHGVVWIGSAARPEECLPGVSGHHGTEGFIGEPFAMLCRCENY
jgi:hypothetical protein